MFNMTTSIFLKIQKFFYTLYFILIVSLFFNPHHVFSEIIQSKNSINGSNLKIPRMVSLKNTLTFMRSGPGKEFPVKFELNKKGYPLKIIAEFNNWRKVTTKNNISGWIHTQLLSSFKTGLIIQNTILKDKPSNSSKSLAKLLPDLLINVKNCKLKWCKIEIIRNKKFAGWVKKKYIWDFIDE